MDFGHCHWCDINLEKRNKKLVVAVSLLIFFLYVNIAYLIVFPWYLVSVPASQLVMILSHILLGSVAYTYYSICTTEPGTIPKDWKPPNVTEEEMEYAKVEPKQPVRNTYHRKIRWCRKCEAFKPPRAHHCKCCKRCIPKMDHHCPYVDQCVGHDNHKVFVLFLWYATLGIGFSLVLYIVRIARVAMGFDEPISFLQGIMVVINVVILGLSFAGLSILFGNQIYLISKNTTKIELWTRHWATRDVNEKGSKYNYPYDRGVWSNLRQFFDSSLLLWCIPTKPQTDGLSYPDLITEEQRHFFYV